MTEYTLSMALPLKYIPQAKMANSVPGVTTSFSEGGEVTVTGPDRLSCYQKIVYISDLLESKFADFSSKATIVIQKEDKIASRSDGVPLSFPLERTNQSAQDLTNFGNKIPKPVFSRIVLPNNVLQNILPQINDKRYLSNFLVTPGAVTIFGGQNAERMSAERYLRQLIEQNLPSQMNKVPRIHFNTPMTMVSNHSSTEEIRSGSPAVEENTKETPEEVVPFPSVSDELLAQLAEDLKSSRSLAGDGSKDTAVPPPYVREVRNFRIPNRRLDETNLEAGSRTPQGYTYERRVKARNGQWYPEMVVDEKGNILNDDISFSHSSPERKPRRKPETSATSQSPDKRKQSVTPEKNRNGTPLKRGGNESRTVTVTPPKDGQIRTKIPRKSVVTPAVTTVAKQMKTPENKALDTGVMDRAVRRQVKNKKPNPPSPSFPPPSSNQSNQGQLLNAVNIDTRSEYVPGIPLAQGARGNTTSKTTEKSTYVRGVPKS